MENKNILEVDYDHTGNSTNTNELGMREMQSRVYQHRNSQYILVKAPPASGKSRALMFVALDKLANQGIKKVIVAVPERTIGRSFANTDLVKYGFYENWKVDPQYDLTLSDEDDGKVKKVVEFLNSSDARILICTHSTLRSVYNEVADDHAFDDIMVAIDEFHHVSSDNSSVLGKALKNIMHNSSAHIMAMTGSYFRGDQAPILTPEDEEKFDRVKYTYYEQLNGYRYLKSFGMDYKFYQGNYLDALDEALDVTKKTIIHIPNINSSESTKDKYTEADTIIGKIGNYIGDDEKTGISYVEKAGKILKIANLVKEKGRDKVQKYLRDDLKGPDDLDFIIALNMAKEGFDWPWAEQALTIGYRHSLTEIVQIIGRVTRDAPNKDHVQFTNMLEQPDEDSPDVKVAVNEIIKAISASLLMEQVLAPKIKFKRKDDEESSDQTGPHIKGLKKPSTAKVKKIIENDLEDLEAQIVQDLDLYKVKNGSVLNHKEIPKVIMTRYPDLSKDEVNQVKQYTLIDMNLSQAKETKSKDKNGRTQKFLKISDKLINVNDLDINLIETVNPFQKAYDIVSRNIDSKVLKTIEQSIDAKKFEFTKDELPTLYTNIKKFMRKNLREPNKNSENEEEVRMAYALARLKILKAEYEAKNKKGSE